MTNQEIFKKAHKIAHELLSKVGNYAIALKIALKRVYKQKKLLDCHAKLWERNDKARIYLNMDFKDFCRENKGMTLQQAVELKAAYYDCISDTFVNCTDFVFSLLGTTQEQETNIIEDDDSYSYEHKKSQKMSEASLKSRKAAALLGDFKALKGTVKQKQWAEHIRLEKLKELDAITLDYLSRFSIIEKAAFWINQKNKSASEIITALKKYERLILARNEINNKLASMRDINKVWTDDMHALQKELDVANANVDDFSNELLGKKSWN